jgi:hypothetical protein
MVGMVLPLQAKLCRHPGSNSRHEAEKGEMKMKHQVTELDGFDEFWRVYPTFIARSPDARDTGASTPSQFVASRPALPMAI